MTMITQQLTQALAKRILVLDGAMGTMIQQYQLAEEDYRGERFAHWQCDVKGIMTFSLDAAADHY
nr:hypothetical protein [Proteus mirabilis]